jgi:hypothetical protein
VAVVCRILVRLWGRGEWLAGGHKCKTQRRRGIGVGG